MNRIVRGIIYIILVLLLNSTDGFSQNLSLNFDERFGLSEMRYKGIDLMSKLKFIGQPFVAEGYKARKKDGDFIYGWSTPLSNKWDAANKSFTTSYAWGTIRCRYIQKADTLTFSYTVTNLSKTDTFYGVSITALVISLPQEPDNFKSGTTFYSNNSEDAAILPAICKDFKIVLESPDVSNHQYIGWIQNDGKNNEYRIWSGTTPFYNMKNFDESATLKLAPGKSQSFDVVMKFSKNGIGLKELSSRTFSQYRLLRPSRIKWKDRRPIGTLFLSSWKEQPFADNERNWIFTHNGNTNLNDFKNGLLKYADNSIRILHEMNAQGMITWDIEGQQYPHPVSYIGSPEILDVIAPEMNKIADEYFRKFIINGFKTGICIRPDSVLFTKDKKVLNHVSVRDPASTLIRKIKYAQKRWKCSFFYIDSNIAEDQNVMNPEIFKKVLDACPGVLLIPEHERTAYYAYSSPYGEFRSGEFTVTEDIKSTYPDAFMTLMVPDGLPVQKTERETIDLLKDSYRQGNIFLFRCWYDDNPTNLLIRKAITEIDSK